MSPAARVPVAFTHQTMDVFRRDFDDQMGSRLYPNLVQNADIEANVSPRSSDQSHFSQLQAGATNPLILEMRSRNELGARRFHLIPLGRPGDGVLARPGR